MADFFDPASQRKTLDLALDVAVEYKNEGNQRSSDRLMESVNQKWCSLTPEQKEQLTAQESNVTSFKRDDKDQVTMIHAQVAEGSVSVPVDCAPEHLESIRQRHIIEDARSQWKREMANIKEMSSYQVQPGDGFDRIARNTLWTGNTFAGRDGEIIENARKIAELNGFNRDNYDPTKRSLQPGQKVQVHDMDWQFEMMLQSIGRINDQVARDIDRK
jgi:hypothetical protein